MNDDSFEAVAGGSIGSLGITLPKATLRERELEAGDEVGILTTADPNILEIHLPPVD